jgi:hypothetical protein
MRRHWLGLAMLALAVTAGCIGAQDEPEVEQSDAPGDADEAVAGLPPVRDTVTRALEISDRWSGEPSIIATDQGPLLITGAGGFSRYIEDPTDAPGNFGQSYIWRSTDDGKSWSFVDYDTPGPTDQYTPYRNAVPGVEGDLAQDEAGRTYFVDLSMLATNGVSASDDAGETWTAAQSAAGLPGTDRPWVQGAGEDEVYVKYLQVNSGYRVARSTDGGQTFLSDVSIPDCSQADLAIDRQAGRLIVPCSNVESEGSLSLLVTPTGEAMDWSRVDVPDAEGPVGYVFSSLAVAGEGDYVFAYSVKVNDTVQVRVRTTTDAGETWSEPVTLSQPGGAGVFPWASANDDGTVAVVWYGTSSPGAPNGNDAKWYPVHAGLRLTETGSTAQEATRTRLTEEPNHEGTVCTNGFGCVLEGRSEDRRLLDFFEVDVDADGTSHVTWTNTQTDKPRIWYGQVEGGQSVTEPVGP